MAQSVFDGGFQIADLATALIPRTAEWQYVDGFVVHWACDAVGELNFSAGAPLRTFELGKNLRGQDVAPETARFEGASVSGNQDRCRSDRPRGG